MSKVPFACALGLGLMLAMSDALAAECTLSAGYEEEPPFHFSDESGAVRGLDADILRATAESVDCSVEFLEVPWNRTLLEVAEGRINIAMGARYLVERAEFAHYSAPYKTQRHSLIGFEPTVSSASTLEAHFKKSNSVLVVRGWHYPDNIRNQIVLPEHQELVAVTPYFESALRMMLAGRADAVIGNITSVNTMLTDMAIPEGKTLSSAEIGNEPLSFLLSRESVSPERALAFDAALKAHLSSAAYRQLFADYDADSSLMIEP